MVKQYKIDEVENLTNKLQEKNNIIFTDYSGVKVQELSSLRRKLREKNAEYKVVKNNLFKLALEKAGFQSLDEHLKGPVAVAFAGEGVGEVAKVLKDFGKEVDAFSYSIGVFDSVLYSEEQVQKIADLPSREELLAKTMMLINGPASGVAMGMNQVMASLARGIKAVAESQGN
jgi:large subunit ribosomal protein L10